MPKIRVSVSELQRRALSEVRKQPGCHNVQEIAINRVAKYAENNWSLCVLAAGAADANTAASAAVHVQTVLRRRPTLQACANISLPSTSKLSLNWMAVFSINFFRCVLRSKSGSFRKSWPLR